MPVENQWCTYRELTSELFGLLEDYPPMDKDRSAYLRRYFEIEGKIDQYSATYPDDLRNVNGMRIAFHLLGEQIAFHLLGE